MKLKDLFKAGHRDARRLGGAVGNRLKLLTHEDGYASLAALLAAACFALLAAQIARTSRSGVVGVNAAAVHARLVAGAEAGVATALAHVLQDDPDARLQIDGRPYVELIEDLTARLAVEDERGKVPLNGISLSQAETLFQLAGASQAEAADLAAALVKWRDPNNETTAEQPNDGARRPADFESTDELRLLPGMTSVIFDRLARSVTVDAGDVQFDPRFASPLAIQVMGTSPATAFDAIQKSRELAGEQTAFATTPMPSLTGRVVTVRVVVNDDLGDQLETATVVQLTGRTDRPYVVRRVTG